MSISAIMIAAIVNFVIGAVWYGVFSKAWMKELELTKAQLNSKDPMPYIISISTSIFSAIGVAYALSLIKPDHIGGAVGIGLSIWWLLAVGTAAKHYAFSKQSQNLFWIDYGYEAVGLAVMSGIIFTIS